MVSPTARMLTDEETRRARPDPRIAQTKKLVLEATFGLISESGFAGATVERIAERSGVARSTIYRHWPNPLPTLHMEALAPLTQRPEEISPTGDSRQDLLAYLNHVVDRLNDPKYAAVSLALLATADSDPAYAEAHRKLITNRTRILNGILRSAIKTKTICSCTDITFEARMLLAPLTHIRFVEHRPVDRALATRLVDRLLQGCRTNGPLCTCGRNAPSRDAG
jgi:AcrR family transcriptional regulator